MAGVVAGIAGFVTFNIKPEFPPLNLGEVDPAIVRSIEDAEEKVRRSPRSADAWGMLATILAVHDFASPADVCFQKAERFSPREPKWPYLRGLMESGENPERALSSFAKAAALCGNAPVPHLRYGEALVERGQTEAAVEQFQLVLKQDSSNPRALLGMGRIALSQGKINESRDYLMRSAEGAPGVKATYMLLATVEQRLNHSKAAGQALAKATTLEETPRWPDPYLVEANRFRTGKAAAANIAEELLRTGRAAEATSLLERTVKAYPDSGKAWLLLGKSFMQQSNYVRAEEALQKALRLEPTSVDVRVELGSALFAQNKFADAEAHYLEAIKIKPNLAEAWFNLGLARMNAQSPDTAIAAFKNAVKYKPDLTYAYIRMGQAFGRLNRPDEAIEQLNQALKLDPNNQEARQMLEILKQFQK